MKFLFAIFISLSAHAESFCAADLSGDSTLNFILYLDALVDQHVLGVEHITQLAHELSNPLGQEQSAGMRIHARELEYYLRDGQLRRDVIEAWATQKTLEMSTVRRERESKSANTQDLVRLGHFVKVKGGFFERVTHKLEANGILYSGAKTATVNVADIMIMDAPVTRAQWLDEMGADPVLSAGPSDEPVTLINFASVAEFANRKSMAMGLKPYYDFMGTVTHGSAEGGNVQYSGPGISITNSNGFRVPRGAEYDYLVANRGKPLSRSELTPATLHEYAWIDFDPREVAHPVKTLRPLMFDGEALFDLLGNVSEWLSPHQYYGVVSQPDLAKVISHPMVSIVHLRKANLGFRLARTLK